MKGLLRYLSPFSPDQSGACAVFFEYGGITVILDAGGCTGNVCGFDEPRWFIKKSAVYSAGLRDMDAILGRDERLIEKLGGAIESFDANFIAIIGTPVPAVIATDMASLKRMAEEVYGIPTVTVSTNGMDTYEHGQKLAYEALIGLAENPLFIKKTADVEANAHDALVWGMTPLDAPSLESPGQMIERLYENEGLDAAVIGMDADIADLKALKEAKINYCVSPSAYKTVKSLEGITGAETRTGFALDDNCTIGGIERIKGNVLIVHQQILANDVREILRSEGIRSRINCASFFEMVEELKEDGDIFIKGEKEFVELVLNGDYGTVIGDPLFKRAMGNADVEFIPLPQYAVSGGMFKESNTVNW